MLLDISMFSKKLREQRRSTLYETDDIEQSMKGTNGTKGTYSTNSCREYHKH